MQNSKVGTVGLQLLVVWLHLQLHIRDGCDTPPSPSPCRRLVHRINKRGRLQVRGSSGVLSSGETVPANPQHGSGIVQRTKQDYCQEAKWHVGRRPGGSRWPG
ncbi:hypothetical protein F5X68DRAFT_57882 [Plectosphaerella plurivora]|uniref:Secreted protein n=1 Tax=Plectosphaerella plurivora TaxID=936078 RepID=A0A9P8VG75_9PEZI|nr:hypothetical protein F5X68DRAFT_57882 [Plectosphaerella plurivora]